jgi:integrase
MEALCLWVDDIDLPGRVINLTPHGTSLTEDAGPNRRARFKTTASAQPIAVPRALVPVLEDWAAHRLDHPEGFVIPPANRIPWLIPGSNRVGPWVSGPPGLKPGDRLAALGERAGIVGRVTWQILRRTWATRAEALGIPDAMGSRQLRHTTIETTKRWYAQRDLNSLKDAVEGFDY